MAEEGIRLKNAGPQVSTISDADVIPVDGADGVRLISKADFAAQLAGAPTSFNPTNAELIEAVANGGPEELTMAYDETGVPTTGTVLWKDGSPGVWTRTLKNTTFNDYDAFTVTHTDSGKTVTQAQVTRNSSGQIISKPPLTVS